MHLLLIWACCKSYLVKTTANPLLHSKHLSLDLLSERLFFLINSPATAGFRAKESSWSSGIVSASSPGVSFSADHSLLSQKPGLESGTEKLLHSNTHQRGTALFFNSNRPVLDPDSPMLAINMSIGTNCKVLPKDWDRTFSPGFCITGKCVKMVYFFVVNEGLTQKHMEAVISYSAVSLPGLPRWLHKQTSCDPQHDKQNENWVVLGSTGSGCGDFVKCQTWTRLSS